MTFFTQGRPTRCYALRPAQRLCLAMALNQQRKRTCWVEGRNSGPSSSSTTGSAMQTKVFTRLSTNGHRPMPRWLHPWLLLNCRGLLVGASRDKPRVNSPASFSTFATFFSSTLAAMHTVRRVAATNGRTGRAQGRTEPVSREADLASILYVYS